MVNRQTKDWKYDKDCAVLIIAWRRPCETERVIDAISRVKPRKIYFACDGARRNNNEEELKVHKTRSLTRKIDWDCILRTRFSEENQGCKTGVNSAIDWFFQSETEGIVIEDDCIPSQDFFGFCSVMLEQYRSDKRIWSISGTRFSETMSNENDAYYFSRYTHSWGWATWKDRWDCHDKEMEDWADGETRRMVRESFPTRSEWRHWRKIWNGLYYSSKPDTWDYQWSLSARMAGALTIIPKVSLVANIGFSEDATHTAGLSYIAPKVGLLSQGGKPVDVVVDRTADDSVFNSSIRRGIAMRFIDRLYAVRDWAKELKR